MLGKSELTQRVAQRTGMPRAQAAKVVNAVVDAVQEALTSNESVSITGFGSWRVTETKARKGRNPRTGQPIDIAAGRRVSVRPGSGLSTSVRGGGGGGGARGAAGGARAGGTRASGGGAGGARGGAGGRGGR